MDDRLPLRVEEIIEELGKLQQDPPSEQRAAKAYKLWRIVQEIEKKAEKEISKCEKPDSLEKLNRIREEIFDLRIALTTLYQDGFSQNDSLGEDVKDRYPFLTYWKEQGFNEFPKIDPEIFLDFLVQPHIKRFREAVKDRLNKSPLLMFSANPEECLYIMSEEAVELNRPKIERMVWERFKQRLIDQDKEIIKQWSEAVKSIVFDGKNRDEAGRDLANKILPKRQGGKTIYSKTQKLILKYIYLELLDAIKEIRRSIWVSLKRDDFFTYCDDDETDGSDAIKKWVPWWNEVLMEKELPHITRDSQISKCALYILSERLTKHTLGSIISPRTLQDILKTVRNLSMKMRHRLQGIRL